MRCDTKKWHLHRRESRRWCDKNEGEADDDRDKWLCLGLRPERIWVLEG